MTKLGKSKEELLAIRKAMLKPKTTSLSTLEDQSASKQSNNFSTIDSKVNPELMSRLAKGEAAEVNKKDMYKLTHKNYN